MIIDEDWEHGRVRIAHLGGIIDRCLVPMPVKQERAELGFMPQQSQLQIQSQLSDLQVRKFYFHMVMEYSLGRVQSSIAALNRRIDTLPRYGSSANNPVRMLSPDEETKPRIPSRAPSEDE
jgi:hypothetical protein